MNSRGDEEERGIKPDAKVSCLDGLNKGSPFIAAGKRGAKSDLGDGGGKLEKQGIHFLKCLV